MFCPTCGRENDDRQEICQKCKSSIPSHFSEHAVPPAVLMAEIWGLAFLSLFLGVLAFLICSMWFCFLPAIAAVLIGHVSLGSLGPNREPGRLFAIVGLVLGYGFLGILFMANVAIPK